MNFGTNREQLKALLLELSVRKGHFKLASGLESDVYIDGKLTTCKAVAKRLIGRIFLDKIHENGWHPSAVGGLIIGAAPIVDAIAHESLGESQYVDSFLVRKEPKKHGMQKFIEGIENTQGVPVVIVDDVCTTGCSTADAIVRARAAGMNVLGAICLVDREMGATKALSVDLGCPFDCVFTLRELLADTPRVAELETVEAASR